MFLVPTRCWRYVFYRSVVHYLLQRRVHNPVDEVWISTSIGHTLKFTEKEFCIVTGLKLEKYSCDYMLEDMVSTSFSHHLYGSLKKLIIANLKQRFDAISIEHNDEYVIKLG